jgi:hypothetical protein
MIETAALIAIGTGAAVLVASTIVALGIAFSPSISRVNKDGIKKGEYQDRLKHDQEAVYMVYGSRRYSRPFSP